MHERPRQVFSGRQPEREILDVELAQPLPDVVADDARQLHDEVGRIDGQVWPRAGRLVHDLPQPGLQRDGLPRARALV